MLQRAHRLAIAMTALAASSIGTGSCAEPHGYAALVRRVAPSVVTIIVEEERVNAAYRAAARAERRAQAETDSNAVNALLRRLLSAQAQQPAPGEDDQSGALGSGFVVREDGLIVTNRHVIADARKVRVVLSDSREVPATIIGSDAVTDLALLKIDAGHLPALKLGSSKQVAVGDAVIAVGNPYGLGQSVSAGIVSARGRTLEDDPYIDFLQTDAAINRGNSGGPLVTVEGTVIGITSVIFSPSGGSVGLGFAIPAETVATVIAQLEAHGSVQRGYLGISGQPVTSVLARSLGMSATRGVLVCNVDAQGPASGSVAIGDVLLEVGTEKVNFRDLSKITARLVPGALVNMAIWRSGGKQAIALKIGRLPEAASNPAMTGGVDTWVSVLHLAVAETTPEIRRALKAGDEPAGLIVTQLRPAGPGALAGLKVGDLITHLGTGQIAHPNDLQNIPAPSTQHPVLLRVVRDGSAVFVAITNEEDPDLPPRRQ